MKKFFSKSCFRKHSLVFLGSIMLMSFALFSCGQQGIYKNMDLIWSEEFNYEGLPDTTNWNIVVGKSRVNNEPQWYTDNPKNLNVSDGFFNYHRTN